MQALDKSQHAGGRQHFLGQLAWLRSEQPTLRRRMQAALNAGQAQAATAGTLLPGLTEVEATVWLDGMSQPEMWFSPRDALRYDPAAAALVRALQAMLPDP